MNNIIKTMITNYILNYHERFNTKTSWKAPLIAYIDADNPAFYELKKSVSPTHAMPKDFLENGKTVVVYFIPFAGDVVNSNINERLASSLWATAYIETNTLIGNLNMFINSELKKIGYNSTVIPATHNFDKDKLISDWSHRHIAYIAGLGSFGLNNMLITEQGCCGRVGSFVTDLALEPSKKEKIEHCLFKYNKTCKKCVSRCVNGALTISGFARHKCYEMCLINASEHEILGLADVCGKCVTGVPCSSSSPILKLLK